MDLDLMNSPENARDPARDMAALWSGSLTKRESASRSIAHMVQARALTQRQLEERRLISRDPKSRGPADAFREIRTRLYALGGAQNFATLVVPVTPGSGGSFVARNLAAAFAFDEAKTALLIDCNLRHPMQHEALGVRPANGGLIDYLDHPALGIENILYHTGIPRMRLIPTGTQRESGGEYFSSFRMRAMIDSLRSRYPDRYLFLDGPAVKGSPDARMLADLADFVVLVVGAGRDTPAAVRKASGNFDPEKLAGTILNQLP
jgi:Mrp family chromosome partitioning ATPase